MQKLKTLILDEKNSRFGTSMFSKHLEPALRKKMFFEMKENITRKTKFMSSPD
jgi:hypothetical protein